MTYTGGWARCAGDQDGTGAFVAIDSKHCVNLWLDGMGDDDDPEEFPCATEAEANKVFDRLVLLHL